jgi:ribulose-phosphate 3-epimerase
MQMFGPIKIAPSLLSADFLNLERDVAAISAAAPDFLHIDVMDGHFVPNLTIGPVFVRALKYRCDIPLDVHLMIDNTPEQLDWYLDAGADLLTVHVESGAPGLACDPGTSRSVTAAENPELLGSLLRRIRAAGRLAGLSLNPGTPASAVTPFLAELDLILVMSVHPGFGGQSFITESLDKCDQLADDAKSLGVNPILEIDGGINTQTAALVAACGADMLVAGNAIFGATDPLQALHDIRAAAGAEPALIGA